MQTDLELAFEMLTAKKPLYDKYFNYYDGKAPLIYSRERLRDIFASINARFTQNWCAVVIDSLLERLSLMQFVIAENEADTEFINREWQLSDMALDADDAHLTALVTGEAYVIAWKEEGEPATAYYNDPRNVHLFYSGDNPRRKRFACKWWVGDDDHRYLTLYYPDRLEYYRSANSIAKTTVATGTLVIANDVQTAASFGEPLIAANPYGEIPVFHLRRESRTIKSELTNIIEIQDSINKLLSDMMVAAEYGAFKQRWVISQVDVRGKFKNSPDEIWAIPAGDGEGQQTSVGEFTPTELGNYLSAVEQMVQSVAVISRTPKHYFLAQGGDPSGEALIAMEAPLNKKAQKYIDRFSSTWRKVAQFMLKLEGKEIDELDITATFDRPETVQPMTNATIRKTNVEAGIPLTTQLRDEGWTQQELDDMQEDKETEQASNKAGLGAALLNAQAGFDRGNQNGNEDVTDDEDVNA